MYKKAKPFFLLVETPLHAGSGSDLGVVDLPIQREKQTGFPKVEASGLKGCIREQFEKKAECNYVSLVFGPDPSKEGEEANDHAGALGFTDARLLLFPVKSMKGVFAWITCPQVLQKFKNELKMIGGVNDFPTIPQANCVPNGSNSNLVISGNKIVLEEYTFSVQQDQQQDQACTKLANWLSEHIFSENGLSYWKEKLEKDLVVLSDDDFADFVKLSTEVITRTKIDDNTGTVAKGALFTEEFLPQESVLYSFALASPLFVKNAKEKETFLNKLEGEKEEDKVIAYFEKCPNVFQLGGDATIGKGIVRLQLWEENHG